jgi:hypothetical protein
LIDAAILLLVACGRLVVVCSGIADSDSHFDEFLKESFLFARCQCTPVREIVEGRVIDRLPIEPDREPNGEGEVPDSAMIEFLRYMRMRYSIVCLEVYPVDSREVI